MNSFFFGDAELFSPPLIGQFLKDSFSDETILQEHEIFFLAFFTSKMICPTPNCDVEVLCVELQKCFLDPVLSRFRLCS